MKASQIVRSQTTWAQNRRYKVYQKLYDKCKKEKRHYSFTSKRFSELNLNPIWKTKYFKHPEIKSISLDLQLSLWNEQNSNHFDKFIQITLPYRIDGYKVKFQKINIPVKEHRHSLKYKDWTRLPSIKLHRSRNNKLFLIFSYEKEDTAKREIKKSIGIDQGYKKLLTCSDGSIYGKELYDIYDKISNKHWGSKSFERMLSFRTSETNRYVNKFFKDHKDIDQVIIEDLLNLNDKSKNHRKTQRWTYRACMTKIERFCEENGIHLLKVKPAYTSQTCSNCRSCRQEIKKERMISCLHCGMEMDADLNASINILRRGVMYPRASKN